MRKVVIAGGVRTPIGDFGGTLQPVKPLDLMMTVMKESLRRGCGQQTFSCHYGLAKAKSNEISLQSGRHFRHISFTQFNEPDHEDEYNIA